MNQDLEEKTSFTICLLLSRSSLFYFCCVLLLLLLLLLLEKYHQVVTVAMIFGQKRGTEKEAMVQLILRNILSFHMTVFAF